MSGTWSAAGAPRRAVLPQRGFPRTLWRAPPEEKAQESVPKRFRSWFVVRLASHTRNSASKNRARGWLRSSPRGLEGRFWNDWPAIRGTELVDTGAWMAPRAVQVGLAGVSHSKRDKRVGIAQSTLKTVQSTLQSTLKTWGNTTVYVKYIYEQPLDSACL